MTRPRRLVVEVSRGTDPPAGRVDGGSDGSSRPFTGWLELIAALDALLHRELPEAAAPDEPQPGSAEKHAPNA